MVTPWMLARLGLMPSRWREAHMLDRLSAEAAALRDRGHDVEAGMVDKLSAVLADEADARERAGHRAELLSYWDANHDGKWDRDERVAYGKELVRVRELADEHGAERRWYGSADYHVFGPLRLTELVEGNPDHSVLVCFDGKSGWVSLRDLIGEN